MSQTKRTLVAERARLEGVVIAALSRLGAVVTLGSLSAITARVEMAPRDDGKKNSAKTYLTHAAFRGIVWKEYGALQREAILVAVAALP